MRFLVTMDDLSPAMPLEVQRRALDFWDKLGLRVTLFCVPRGGELWRADRAPDWQAWAREGRAAGHDLQLHGLDHAAYEFGPTPDWVRALGGEAEERTFRRLRPELEGEWRADRFVEKLRLAQDIFAAAVGEPALVFRSGALSQSPPLYEALAAVGLKYASNAVVNPRGWDYIVGKYDSDRPWDPEVPPRPYRLPTGTVMLPMISEYAWYVPEAHLAQHVALAREDRRRVREEQGVFVLLCHAQCVGGEEGYAREILGRVIAETQAEGEVTFGTLRDLVAEIEAGELAPQSVGGAATGLE